MWRLIEAGFAVVMVVGFPAFDVVTMGRLKRNSTHASRMSMYRLILLVEWLAVFATLLIEGLGWHRSGLFLHPYPNPLAGKALSRGFTHGLMATVTVAFVVALLAPVVVGRIKPEALSKIHDGLKPVAFLLPQDGPERATFALVAVTAGICEEVLYRGFLLHVSTTNFGLTVGWALASALLAFAVAHAYQGWRGVAASAILGGVFMGMYLLFGSLVPAIVLHALIDLRPLLLLPRRGTPFEHLTPA